MSYLKTIKRSKLVCTIFYSVAMQFPATAIIFPADPLPCKQAQPCEGASGFQPIYQFLSILPDSALSDHRVKVVLWAKRQAELLHQVEQEISKLNPSAPQGFLQHLYRFTNELHEYLRNKPVIDRYDLKRVYAIAKQNLENVFRCSEGTVQGDSLLYKVQTFVKGWILHYVKEEHIPFSIWGCVKDHKGELGAAGLLYLTAKGVMAYASYQSSKSDAEESNKLALNGSSKAQERDFEGELRERFVDGLISKSSKNNREALDVNKKQQDGHRKQNSKQQEVPEDQAVKSNQNKEDIKEVVDGKIAEEGERRDKAREEERSKNEQMEKERAEKDKEREKERIEKETEKEKERIVKERERIDWEQWLKKMAEEERRSNVLDFTKDEDTMLPNNQGSLDEAEVVEKVTFGLFSSEIWLTNDMVNESGFLSTILKSQFENARTNSISFSPIANVDELVVSKNQLKTIFSMLQKIVKLKKLGYGDKDIIQNLSLEATQFASINYISPAEMRTYLIFLDAYPISDLITQAFLRYGFDTFADATFVKEVYLPIKETGLWGTLCDKIEKIYKDQFKKDLVTLIKNHVTGNVIDWAMPPLTRGVLELKTPNIANLDQFTQIPKELRDSVIRINFLCQNIRVLKAENFKDFPNLEEIDFSGCAIEQIQKEAFAKAPKLQKVNMKYLLRSTKCEMGAYDGLPKNCKVCINK